MRLLTMLLVLALFTGCSTDTTSTVPATDSSANGSSEWTFDKVAGPLTLNSDGRGVFASVLLDGESLLVTYQIAPEHTLSADKNLYLRTYDRSLKETAGQTTVIDVHTPLTIDGKEAMDFDGDLGDHKWVLMGDYLYFVSILKGKEQVALLKFDKNFKLVDGPLYFGKEDPKVEAHLDMGFCGDGHHLYAQFYHQNNSPTPDGWSASIYQLSTDLEEKNQALLVPDKGSFVTGTACVFLKKGEMGADQDRLQIFSTNKDYGHKERVGIHTFGANMMLKFIDGSRLDIIEEKLDVYFPTGPSFNKTHNIWVVGYTMENEEGEHGSLKNSVELGPSFIQIFDENWKSIKTIPVNEGDKAFRVMTQTEGDDIYVVYDEMDRYGAAKSSRARIEHYRITKPNSGP